MSACLKAKNSPKTTGCRKGSKSSGILAYPPYTTCGNRNPYYKYNDYYYSPVLKRNIARCQMEDYWSEFLWKSISANPNENLIAYYNSIVTYIRSMFSSLVNKYRIRYSNLSTTCSALLLIKRTLSRFLSQEEISRVMIMLQLDNELEDCAICD